MADWRMHPEEDKLLRYCDGELRARESARVARHLEACWDCRTRVDDLKQTIAEYVRYRRDVLEPALPQPPRPWKNLRAEFAQVTAPRRILPRPAVWLLAGTLTAGTGMWFYAEHSSRPAGQASLPVHPQGEQSPLPVVPRPSIGERPLAGPRPQGSGPEDELAVIAALDRIGADLGDPIEVARTRDRVVVTCIGLDAERMRQVRQVLAGIPRVTVELSPKPNVSAAGTPLEVVGAPHANVPAEISRQFGSPAVYQAFVDGVLRSSEAMMSRAHALRTLATRFPAGVEAQMGADSRTLLEAIREHHEAALAAAVPALAHSVAPYLGPPAQAPQSRPVHESWQTRAVRVFEEAGQVDRSLGAVFAGSQNPAAGDAGPAALQAALARLDSDVAH